MKLARTMAALAALSPVPLASPAAALTNDNGVIVFTHADAIAGGVTPGDTPGYPVIISAPGSYRLGSSLTVTTNVDGISVTAAEVTIDFAGFRLIGSGVGDDGISTTQRALTVKNGTIRAFFDVGIRSSGVGLIVDGMRLVQNYTGVSVQGEGARILNSAMISNLASGIVCQAHCYARGNTIIGNGGDQLSLSGGSNMVLGNLLSGDGGPLTNPVFNPGYASGWGDNAMNNFVTPSDGTFFQMSPNSCTPSGC